MKICNIKLKNKYNNYLIRFMIKKDQIIRKHTRIKYLVYSDIKAIKNWNNEESKKIWKNLKNFVKGNSEGKFKAYGLNWKICPFCIKFHIKHNDKISLNCKICSYGITHGKCDNKTSTYDLILFNAKKYMLIEIFNNDFYQEIIKEIEGGER